MDQAARLFAQNLAGTSQYEGVLKNKKPAASTTWRPQSSARAALSRHHRCPSPFAGKLKLGRSLDRSSGCLRLPLSRGTTTLRERSVCDTGRIVTVMHCTMLGIALS